MTTVRCPATWTDPLGRHRCCRLTGHDGPHIKSRHPSDDPTPAVPEIVPPSSVEYGRLARGKS